MSVLPSSAPWAMRLVTDRLPASPPAYATVALNSVTQIARYLDLEGQPVTMAKHGTNKTSGTASMSGGGDGDKPQPQRQDDNTTDYASD